VDAPPLPPDMDGAAFKAHERADERARCFSVKIVSIQLSRGIIGLERPGRLRRRLALLFVLRCAAEVLHCLRSSCVPCRTVSCSDSATSALSTKWLSDVRRYAYPRYLAAATIASSTQSGGSGSADTPSSLKITRPICVRQ